MVALLWWPENGSERLQSQGQGIAACLRGKHVREPHRAPWKSATNSQDQLAVAPVATQKDSPWRTAMSAIWNEVTEINPRRA